MNSNFNKIKTKAGIFHSGYHNCFRDKIIFEELFYIIKFIQKVSIYFAILHLPVDPAFSTPEIDHFDYFSGTYVQRTIC